MESSGKRAGGDGIQSAGDVRVQLEQLERSLAALRTEFEQFFLGILPLPPEKHYTEVKRHLRQIQKLPFKNSRLRFQSQALERRFQSYDMYWQRTLKAKENGTYYRDVFKADLKARIAHEEAKSQSAGGAAERYVQGLFKSYSDALEKTLGRKQEIDYGRFKDELVKRAKALKEQAPDKKVTFRVVNKGGKITVEAKLAERSAEGSS